MGHSDQVVGVQGENKVFLLHLLPFRIRLKCHTGPAWQLRLQGVRHIDGYKIIAVSLHMENVNAHHGVVVRNGRVLLYRDIEGGGLTELHLVHQRPGRSVAFGLIKGLGKGFCAVAAELPQSGFQRFIQQSVALGHVIVGDLPVLVQLQRRQGPLDNGKSFIRGFCALYRVLVGGPGHFAPGHS